MKNKTPLDKVLILADGDALPLTRKRLLAKGRTILALDGAAESARKEGWKPDVILGDFDSISASTLKFFAHQQTEIVHAPDQNYTDLEKALALCLFRGSKSIWIAQAWGERIDHSFAHLSFLSRFHHPRKEIISFTNQSKLRFLKEGKRAFTGKSKRGFAILPFPRCELWSQGLEYEANGLTLELGKCESVSNRTLKKEVQIRVKGAAIVVEDW